MIAVAVASMLVALFVLLAAELVRQARVLDAYQVELDAVLDELEAERARRRKAEARASHAAGPHLVRLRRT